MSHGLFRISIASRFRPYVLELGSGLLANVGDKLRAHTQSQRIALLTDENVNSLWGKKLVNTLNHSGFETSTLLAQNGESAKTLSQLDSLYESLIEWKFTRNDQLVTLGGGSISDLGGFLASTFHRGMPVIHLPSTLLAMVDASIGGKVAINHRLGKNLIGGFYPPQAIYSDTHFLSTLSEKQIEEGLSEMVKAALIGSPDLFERFEHALQPSLENIQSAIEVKARIVSADEFETNQRAWLNFGHTLGHALETVAGADQLSHGQAVLLGMRAATRLSTQKGLLAPFKRDRILKLLSLFQGLTAPLSVDVGKILATLSRDKKSVEKQVRWVLLKDIGVAEAGHVLPEEWVADALATVLQELPR